jgi:hypothetical protein
VSCSHSIPKTHISAPVAQGSGDDDDDDGVCHVREAVLTLIDGYRDIFLRDGKMLAAHMVGTMELDKVMVTYDSSLFSEVDEKSGRLKWLVETAAWGPVDDDKQA